MWDGSVGLFFFFYISGLPAAAGATLEHVSAPTWAEEQCRVLGKLQSRTEWISLVPLLHSLCRAI